MNIIRKLFIASILTLTILVNYNYCPAFADNFSFIDARANKIEIKTKPCNVVSLVPAITDIILNLGESTSLKGVTYHDNITSDSKIINVGSFFNPSVEKIEEIKPDVIFISSLQKKVREKFQGKAVLIELDAHSIDDIYKNITILGKIYNKENKAQQIIENMQNEINLVSKKVNKIPESQRKKVIRLMGRDTIMTPGDDSFQNDYIRKAGGIPPVFNKRGNVVPISKEEWIKFNPQIIYACGGDTKAEAIIQKEQGWKDVDAVKNRKIFYFPCEYTCRASVDAGNFISLLSSRIYENEFFKQENLVKQEKITGTKKINNISLDYISDVRVDYSDIYDFPNKTLVIDFKQPMTILSTLEGQQDAIDTVGNHSLPPESWLVSHKIGYEKYREKIYSIIGQKTANSSFLSTGADMDNLSIQKQIYKDLTVYALVTAGVETNAVRLSKDEGRYYEPGTINIIILCNRKMTPGAMAKAVITATEAKTAVMQDLDIRSKQTPQENQATGTGTDNIVIVQGSGSELDKTGSHAKAGELIAKAVYAGVIDAIYKQNGINNSRNIFDRLKERNISLFDLIDSNKNPDKKLIVSSLEELLLESEYESFIEAALALSDAQEQGHLKNNKAFEKWCYEISSQISGKKNNKLTNFIDNPDMPEPLKMALNAILNGIYLKNSKI
jgi:ABC-type Fe3+-hydroxamate transport system substrate-binding protein/adenosylcobinamide amidohydrolase